MLVAFHQFLISVEIVRMTASRREGFARFFSQVHSFALGLAPRLLFSFPSSCQAGFAIAHISLFLVPTSKLLLPKSISNLELLPHTFFSSVLLFASFLFFIFSQVGFAIAHIYAFPVTDFQTPSSETNFKSRAAAAQAALAAARPMPLRGFHAEDIDLAALGLHLDNDLPAKKFLLIIIVIFILFSL